METKLNSVSAATKAPRMSTAVQKGPGELVLIKVGTEKKGYHVHRCFLVYYSEYFRRALQGNWAEVQDYEFVLEDIETGTFNIFINWLYTQKLPGQDEEWVEVTKCEIRTTTYFSANLERIKAVAFGDRFMAPKFQQQVHNLLVDTTLRYQQPPAYETIILAFHLLPYNSEALDLLVDEFCEECTSVERLTDHKLRTQLPQEFLLRAIDRFRWMRYDNKKQMTPLEKRCSYHKHETPEERAICQKRCEREQKDFMWNRRMILFSDIEEDELLEKEVELTALNATILGRVMRGLPQKFKDRDGELSADEDSYSVCGYDGNF